MAEETVSSLVSCGKSESDVSSSGETSIGKPSSPDTVGRILPSSNRISSDSRHDFNDSRRNSTGKPSPQKSNQKVVPHYLRASTGSCHDFCKYGHKHAFEEKERYPLRKRIIRTPSEKQNPAVTSTLVESKKATVLKQMVSPDVKSHSLNHGGLPGAINSADPPEIMKLLPHKKVEVYPKCDLLSQPKKLNAEKRMNNFSNKHSASLQPTPMKQSLSFHSLKSAKKVEKAEMAASNMSLKSSPSVGAQPSAKKAGKAEKARNNLSQKFSSVGPQPPVKKAGKSENVRNNLSQKSSSVGPQPPVKKARKAENVRNNSSQKSSSSVGQQRAVSKSSLLFRAPQSINGRGVRKDDTKASKKVVTKASAKKVFTTPTALLSPKPSMNRNVTMKSNQYRSIKVISSLKVQNRIQKEEMEKTDGEKAPEKTLHVIVAETRNDIAESTEDTDVVPSLTPQSVSSPKSLSQPLSPSLSSQEGREGEDDDDAAAAADDDDDDDGEEEEEGGGGGGGGGELEVYDDVDDEEEEVEEENGYSSETAGEFSNKNRIGNNNEIAVEENRRRTLRKGVLFSDSKDPRPVKLKFKRGKVVDILSENNGPRRLRFRQGRVVEENHGHKGEIRRKNFKKKGPDGDGNGINPSNEKVVLRHQDMQGRKDAQGLFNNVIEETASKLVESRKSKVKALVGAFETVISLQDAKPSPQAAS